jgi:hypothetical protein
MADTGSADWPSVHPSAWVLFGKEKERVKTGQKIDLQGATRELLHKASYDLAKASIVLAPGLYLESREFLLHESGGIA